MQPDTQLIVHNTYQNTVQSAKVKQAKKCIINFAIFKVKKDRNSTVKKPDTKTICKQNEFAYTIM